MNDFAGSLTSEGRRYNPDLVVIEEGDKKPSGWLVETKADKDMTSAEVVAKRRAAKKWANPGLSRC
jgi:type III restriction enzyme